MKQLKYYLASLGFILCFPLAYFAIPSSENKSNDSTVREKISYLEKNDPGWLLSSYPRFDSATTLLSRVQDAPPELLASAGKEDQRVYTSYALTNKEFSVLKHSLTQLPKAFIKPLQEHLIGIYFINDLKTSGWTQTILNSENLDYQFIMMLHPKVLKLNLSEWLTDKENSAFHPDQNGLSVQVNTGDQVSGLTGILIHECAHVFDHVYHVTPYLDRLTYDIIHEKTPNQIKQFQKYGTPFLQSVWPNRQDKIATEYQTFIPERPIFYATEKEKLTLSAGLTLHQNMINMPYTSLYSLIGWGEDYAEMALFNHVTQILKQPYQIEFYEGEQIVFKSEPMNHPLVKSRLPIIDSYHDYPISIPTPENLPLDKIVGQYEKVLPSNPFHHVSISLNQVHTSPEHNQALTWSNQANVSWKIKVNKNKLDSGKDHPYLQELQYENMPPDFLDYHMDWRQSESGEIRLCAIHHLGEWYIRI